MGFLFVIIVGVLFWVLRAVIKNPSLRRFDAPLDPARASFLADAFGIYPSDLARFRFDGQWFHFRLRCSYMQFEGLKAGRSEIVRISEAHLPHSRTWTYTRIDGGPDRRYSGNVEIRHSQRIPVLLMGQRPFTLDVYASPGSGDWKESYGKIDRFLAGGYQDGYEQIFNEYHTAFTQHAELTKSVERLRRSELECARVMDAFESLGPAHRDKLVMEKVGIARAEHDRAEKEITLAMPALSKCVNAMMAAARAASSQADTAVQRRTAAELHRTVTQFRNGERNDFQ